ncbi:MAG: hypothetical protein J0L82_15665 [Deltaproteobacteria bacterium]|nr:hypothetical protein [Deltaproteobacteria bacterium]
MKIAFLVLSVSTLAGCHTMGESYSSSTSHQTSYQIKNHDGETVHRTVRVAERYPVVITPVAPTYPQPVYPAPITAPVSAPGSAPVATEPVKIDNELPPATASAKSSSKTGFNGSLDLAWTSGHLHLGAHAGISFTEWFMVRLGLSAFASKDLYLGGDLATRFHAPLGRVRPFVGAGAYFGDSKKCSTDYNSSIGVNVEICDKKFLSAGYGEAGIEFGHVSIFVRDYRLFRAGLSIPTEMFWGVGLQF